MQRKKFVKCISLAMTLMLVFSIMAGCGDNSIELTTTAAGAATTAVEDSKASEAEGTEEVKEVDNGDATILTVEVFDRGLTGSSDPTNNYWTKWINEQMLKRYNIDVQFESIPRSEEIQQLNVKMAGRNAPDIAFTYTASVVYNYYKQGGLTDLTDLIEAEAPTLKTYLGEELLSYGNYDGRQYAIPAKRVSLALSSTFIRKDWLDALGLDIPDTREEFYNALVAFKEENPGNVENVIPYSMATDLPYYFGIIAESFIDPDLTEEQAFVRNVAASYILYPGFKDSVAFMNKMYNAGLIDPQFPMYKDWNPVADEIKRGAVGSFVTNYDYPIRTAEGIYNTLKENVPTAELIPIDPFENAKGDKAKEMYSPAGIYNFVPASSADRAEAAVKYLNFLCEDEVRIFLTVGEDGVNHTKDADGIPVMINLENDDRMMNSPNNLDYAIIVNGVDLGNEEDNVKVLSKSYEEGYEDFFTDSYRISMNDAIRFNPDTTPFEIEAQYTASLTDKRREILATAIMASEEDFDRVYDEGLESWLAAGGQEILDERQAYWDEHKAG